VQRRNQAAEAAAELRQSIQKERERADALAQDLSMTRSAIYAYEAQVRKPGDEAAELRQAAANGAPSLRKSPQSEPTGRSGWRRISRLRIVLGPIS
jgi:septal ring factor EnvC (AmiA/AmiB activator)